MVAIAVSPNAPRANAAVKAAKRAAARRAHPVTVAVAVSPFGEPYIAAVDAPTSAIRAVVRQAVFTAMYAVETASGYVVGVDDELLADALPASLIGKVDVRQVEVV